MEPRRGSLESVGVMNLSSFYKGKKVLITGHTGFKGAWLSRTLKLMGAEVHGYALEPPTDPSLFEILGADSWMDSRTGDIRDMDALLGFVRETSPEIIFHMAAQPLVRRSYEIPRETFEVNVMGTVNVLEAARLTGTASSIVNVTTDKVYRNLEVMRGYSEEDSLDGYDPYSNSKACSDIVTHGYRDSFLAGMGISVSTARAGNVIGGGDFAADRIIPDCVRAASKGETIIIRNPDHVRPFQHVLEPLAAYLLIAMAQTGHPELAGAYNVGPDPDSVVTAGRLADIFAEAWGDGVSWEHRGDGGPHEAGLLMLDASKLKDTLGWVPTWSTEDAVRKTVEWSRVYYGGGDIVSETDREIREFFDV